MKAAAKQFVPAGTVIEVRRTGTEDTLVRITTTKVLEVPGDAETLSEPEYYAETGIPTELFFQSQGYDVVVRAADVVTAAAPACRRCGGNGTIPAYSHVRGGVCFSCGGHGARGVKAA